jgi:hypothetical protein
MESRNMPVMTEENTGMAELELSQLSEITGGATSVGAGICQGFFFKDGHLVKSPPPPVEDGRRSL